LEALECRELLAGMPVTPPHDLQDPLVQPVAQAEFIQDHGQLKRMEVIHLLEVVDGTATRRRYLADCVGLPRLGSCKINLGGADASPVYRFRSLAVQR
jgi:hypothetical protein